MASSSESHGTHDQTPHERAMANLRDDCRELYRQMGRDAMLRQGDPVETLFAFAKRLISEQSYVIGWNDGFAFRDKRNRPGRSALASTGGTDAE